MNAPRDVPWWKRTTTYQIYPRSFADANGDGIGDLRGIIGKLDYLQTLGVETLWLSPFFESPQTDFGYDITNHHAIAPEYGSLDDCRELIADVHARGMKIVFDMVLNHTSAEHPWFVASRSSRDHPMRDFYIWREGRRPHGKAPPNNWRSMLGGSGWRYDPHTEEWYFASFLGFQPDLNYRNPRVKAAMLEVVRHWLGEGVDGFRLDIFNAIFKDESFRDNPFSWRPVPSEDNPHGFFQRQRHTIDHPDTIAFARELRGVVDEFCDPPRFLVGEVFGDASTLRRYCGEAAEGLHLVFLFKAMQMRFAGRS
jgi:alpha-glucosidase